jgi:hypothetical protein
MSRFVFVPALAAALAVSVPAAVLAAAEDYAFEAVTEQVEAGPDAAIDVRLVHKPTGKPAEHAVIFESRIDRSPDGLGDVVTHPTPADEIEPGVYRLRADLGEPGRWAVKLQAKVPGEDATIPGEVVIDATGPKPLMPELPGRTAPPPGVR